MGKYEHLVHTFKKEETRWGDFVPPFQAYFRGDSCMPDAKFYTQYRPYMKEAYVDREPNFHAEEEYLCFIGYDLADPFGSFDAVIEIWIGKDIDNMEQHIITEPTIIRIPPYTWHCPLRYLKVNKPVYLESMLTKGRFGVFVRRFDENGRPYYPHSVAGKKMCILEPQKQCNVCGRCFKDYAQKEEAAQVKPWQIPGRTYAY